MIIHILGFVIGVIIALLIFSFVKSLRDVDKYSSEDDPLEP